MRHDINMLIWSQPIYNWTPLEPVLIILPKKKKKKRWYLYKEKQIQF